jgi:hypothetical protein
MPNQTWDPWGDEPIADDELDLYMDGRKICMSIILVQTISVSNLII